jgi:glycosyltransferase involved in cell wall biosynthesis
VFLLLYAGRVAKEKNIGMLLRAFKAVMEKLPGTRLMIAGEGPYEDACKEKAHELGIKDGVLFTGVLSHTDIARAYHTANIFVFPSVTDTQGLVVCEALTTGLPCVAVRAGGIPEVIDDGKSGILTKN